MESRYLTVVAVCALACTLFLLLGGFVAGGETGGGRPAAGGGTIVYTDVEGGTYGILADDGSRYLPLDLDAGLRIEGLPVVFAGEVQDFAAAISGWGAPIDLTMIRTPTEAETSFILWEGGKPRYLGGPDSPVAGALLEAAERAESPVRCTLTGARLGELKDSHRLIEATFVPPLPPEGPLGDARTAVFVLEEESAEGLGAHILIQGANDSSYDCYAVSGGEHGAVDDGWVEEVLALLAGDDPGDGAPGEVPHAAGA